MQSILARLRENSPPPDIFGLNDASTALLLARAVASLGRTLCCLVPSDDQLERLAQDIAFFSEVRVLLYPSYEIPPYTPLSPDPATVCTRLATLYQLQGSSEPFLILTSAEAVLRRILPLRVLNRHCELVIAGEEIDREQLVATLIASGYQPCDLVRQEGDLAVRGGIIDVYPPSLDSEKAGPLRLDFFGDTVESIRLFDPISQRSRQQLEEAILLPVSDLLFPDADEYAAMLTGLDAVADQLQWLPNEYRTLRERFASGQRFPGMEFLLPLLYGGRQQLQSLFHFLPPGSSLILDDPLAIRQRMRLVRDRIAANYAEATALRAVSLPPDDLFVTENEFEELLDSSLLARFCSLPDPDCPAPALTVSIGDHSLLAQEIELERRKRGLLAPLADRIQTWQQEGESIVLACRSGRQAEHLRDMLAHYQIRAALHHPPCDPEARLDPDQVHCFAHPLSKGFDLLEEKSHFLSALELFGEKRLGSSRRRKRVRPEGQPVEIDQLNPGDVVVHRDHGVGIFQRLVNMDISGQQSDFMLITYRGDDKLYVPVDRLHWVSRYQGLTDQAPKLDSLGSQRWQTAKKKVKEAVWKIAQELLDTYARRAMQHGHRFSPPGDLYRRLEESFPYDETVGQAKAIDEVLDDLTRDQPMDRLICGDVGYGKTEVAARAAFKAIEDGFQVAILVPTTVLAEQHAATFRDRFATFPVTIASLNRFRSSSQQKKMVADLAAGRIDLVVGTHRLLSKDVHFHKLGLLIVDEEHRFGVAHKEKLKKLKATVDVLTLTATPIPRTLQMSLLGIRDLSVISSPPRERRSVKTFLARYDQLVIREAVLREMERKGQLFFVHNRVKSIHRIADTVAALIPQARIGVAHGQMPGPQLEDIMVRFINHELDILVCTTIIESGLDIPNANTIIINRADHLGLADIYQLRGRVGRSSRQAYAYLLVPSLDHLTGDAQQRLRALMDCSELGGGFKLAMNDLQIRGGGNLLGVSQSGHIASVGYDLYLELLQTTVAELKQQAANGSESSAAMTDLDPEIKIRLPAFLPDSYIAETSQRYQAYRRIATTGNGTAEDLAELTEELIDRYGPLPREAENLLTIIRLKQECRVLGISKLEQGVDNLIVSFIPDAPIEPQRVRALLERKPTRKNPLLQPARLTPDHRLVVPFARGELFAALGDLMHTLQGGNA
ncbi:transcription-repair coupling factor [Desulfobulbus alkaliphilus]|uniref:transcription-repair coupling factor n=1 Tax=Desulfobulbus alkaliphilus TaxID=869814 RepID=UPI001965776C|nr:transcription-repair coupling factor [Desulfobulbus alkaliphilus]MBM9538382.1 transcription-repair coupling factor [Desulfobulbus alkaliphilus]